MAHRRPPKPPLALSKTPKEANPLPKRFDLAPLIKLDPERVVPKHGNDRFSMFMLALAVVFNDLKGILLFFGPIAPSKPQDDEISGHAGEWRGLDLQLHRYRVGLIHELITLLGEFEEEATGRQMQQILRKATPKTRSNWSDLVKIATDKEDTSKKTFANKVVRIRNNIAFHYYRPKDLLAGYRHHFFGSQQTEAHNHAYCSIGKDMESTRFFFADAAIQGALTTIQGDQESHDFLQTLNAVSKEINSALEHILREHTRLARIP